jgi:hypothetical protein
MKRTGDLVSGDEEIIDESSNDCTARTKGSSVQSLNSLGENCNRLTTPVQGWPQQTNSYTKTR